jgi:hypothetical protein
MRVLVIAALLATAVVGGACKDDEPVPTGKRMLGSEGRERWVVTFDGKEPDLSEYKGLIADAPDEVESYAAKRRAQLSHDHADFEAQVQALDGKVVERWWMSNALTIEVKPEGVPTLRGFPGVKSMTPDVPLE